MSISQNPPIALLKDNCKDMERAQISFLSNVAGTYIILSMAMHVYPFTSLCFYLHFYRSHLIIKKLEKG